MYSGGTPIYYNSNLNTMAFSNDDLIWGNSDHDIIRNMKITYPVVYLGNYELDHTENVGSHLAVDIKVPIGTPIHAMANGKVVKTSMSATGVGHHVVIKHPDAADPNGSGSKVLYSSYVHMDEINVSEGQNVLKGHVIGTSGNTGTSTTPHLHFQIDTDDAPWHPYWPFSWAESQAAGLSFFEAVNAGLGVNKAKLYTTNPMEYVRKHLNTNSVASNNPGSVNPNPDNGDSGGDSGNQETPDSEEDTQGGEGGTEDGVEVIDTSLFTFNLRGESSSLLGNGVTVIATSEASQLAQLSDNDEIRVELSGVGKLIKKTYIF